MDVAVHQGDEPAVDVLELLLERESPPAVRPVSHHGHRALLQQEGSDRGPEAARPSGYQHDAPSEALAPEVVPVLGLLPGVIGVEEARRQGGGSAQEERAQVLLAQH